MFVLTQVSGNNETKSIMLTKKKKKLIKNPIIFHHQIIMKTPLLEKFNLNSDTDAAFVESLLHLVIIDVI